LQTDAAVVEGQASARLEDAESRGKDEVELGVVAELCAIHPRGARRVGSSVPDPAAPVEVDRVSAWALGLHVVLFPNRELMTVVGGNDEVLDPCCSEFSDGPCDVADYALHSGARGQLVDVLPKRIDLLRVNDDQRLAIHSLAQLIG